MDVILIWWTVFTEGSEGKRLMMSEAPSLPNGWSMTHSHHTKDIFLFTPTFPNVTMIRTWLTASITVVCQQHGVPPSPKTHTHTHVSASYDPSNKQQGLSGWCYFCRNIYRPVGVVLTCVDLSYWTKAIQGRHRHKVYVTMVMHAWTKWICVIKLKTQV